MIVGEMASRGSSPLQLAVRRSLPTLQRPRGCSDVSVFPIPVPEQTPVKGGDLGFLRANVALLNLLYAGRVPEHCSAPSTATQRRVCDLIAEDCAHFTGCGLSTASVEEFDAFSLSSLGYAGPSGVVEPLDERGGIPEEAAVVQTAEVLKNSFPQMSAQLLRPSKALLPSRMRPTKLQKPYTFVGPGYGNLMKRASKAGLVQLRSEKRVARHRGKLLVSGDFAVRKNETETRVITDVISNQLIDETSLPRPSFAHIPRLRAYYVSPSHKILVNKVDARHYFHVLSIGERWKKYLAHNPISTRKGLRYPVHCAIPMGFKPACGYAQAVTDHVVSLAGLPSNARVVPEVPCPSQGAIWGSIVDDIWALDCVPKVQGEEEVEGKVWMQRCCEAWDSIGVTAHPDKIHLGLEGGEVQGYHVDSHRRSVGVSLAKRWLLVQALLRLLMQRRVPVRTLWRLVGKLGFVHSARVCLRSLLEVTYQFLQDWRAERSSLVVLPPIVWWELFTAMLSLPFAQFRLDGAWTSRVEVTDASLSGLGRATTEMPEEVVADIARLSDHKGFYTNLSLPWGISLTEEPTVKVKKVEWPIDRCRWLKFAAPRDAEVITLNEADAIVWSVLDRLRRPQELRSRVLVGTDSAACCGALCKGRSKSRRLNARCRQVAAILLAGRIELFVSWLSTKVNPADEPSRRWEIARIAKAACTLAAPVAVPKVPSAWSSCRYQALLLCGGRPREGDVRDFIQKLAAHAGCEVYVEIADPAASASADLLNPAYRQSLADRVRARVFFATFSSPPCCSWSAVRHVPMKHGRGPRPLRARADPWIPIRSDLTASELKTFHVGTFLMLICWWITHLQAESGGWVGFEHPDDRGFEPYCSIWSTSLFACIQSFFSLQRCIIDQCMYGSASKKRTTVVVSARPPHCLCMQCTHNFKHVPLAGSRGDGQFKTTNTGEYPPALSKDIAEAAIATLLAKGHAAGRGRRGVAQGRHQSSYRAVWPASCLELFDDYCAGRYDAEILGGAHRIQA